MGSRWLDHLVWHGSEGTVYRFDQATAQISPLVLAGPAGGQLFAHSWLDDARLLYRRNDGRDSRSLSVRTVATGDERVLIDHPRFGAYWPSPDGTKIAYAVEEQQGGATVVNSLDVATGATTEIMRAGPGQFGNLLLWTPGWRSLLFARNEQTKPSIWVIPAGGGQARALNLQLGPGYSSMRMHPDGRRIAYQTGNRAIEVWRLDNFLPSAPSKSTRR